MAKKKTEKDAARSFEEYLKEIEEISDKLESGETGLDEAIGLYEKGMELSVKCAQALKEAKLKVETLKKKKKEELVITENEEPGEDEEEEEYNDDDDTGGGRLPF
ncbi:MAG: exodeoxyribonuclease VII small subunit [Candidatus Goldiibacteriota bacterium]